MRVLVSDALEMGELGALEAAGIEVVDRRGVEADELIAALADCEGLLVRSRTLVGAEVFARCPRLRVVGRAGSGVDNIDLEAATRAGVLVCNVSGGNTNAAAEHTLALILALARHLPQAARSLGEGRWERSRFVGVELRGRTLGVVGLGRIGQFVARGARGLGMTVIASDPLARPEVAEGIGVELVPLDDLAARADFVTLHVPLVKDTHGLIGRAFLSRAKPGVRILNVARGGLIDEEALLEALNEERVAGAALDVFESEPPAPSELLRHPAVIATPHLGASTEEAQRGVARRISEQVADYLVRGIVRGGVNVTAVDPQIAALATPWLELSTRLGTLVQSLHPDGIHRLEARTHGEPAAVPKDAVVAAALTGALRPLVGDRVTPVNARRIAEERSLELRAQAHEQHATFQGLLRVSVGEGERQSAVEGLRAQGRGLRLMGALGFEVDAPLEGAMLFVENEDRPGMIARIGSLVAEAGLNVACMAVGRRESEGRALSVLNLDSAPDENLLERLQAADGIRWARGVSFDTEARPSR